MTSSSIEAKPFTVRALRRKFEQGIFAIPELQREFVWKESKIPELLDSMYRRFPIGTALVWKTERRNQHLLRKRLHILPDFDPGNREIWYLVDGQQRLSVIWQLIRDPSGPVIVGRRSIDFRCVYFRLRPAEGEHPFVFRARPPSEPAVRVVDILSDRWKQKLKHHGARATTRIADCRSRLLDYPIWLMFVASDNLDDVRDTFVRINSQGTPIRSADRAFARAANVNLRGLMRELREQLFRGFEGLSEETILQAAGLLLGSKDVGARAIDRVVRNADATDEGQQNVRRLWARLAPAFAHAVDYVRQQFAVRVQSDLPSETMIAVLAGFFYFNRCKRPSRHAKRQIAYWFWSTAVGARYTGRGFRQNLVRDVELMQRLAEGGRARFKAELVPIEDVARAEYSRPGSLTNGFFCMLRLQRPRYLDDGEPIPIEHIARGNRSDKHHIFPRALLRRAEVPLRKVNSLPNVCLLVAQENQSVGQKHPREYLFVGGRARARAAQSHLIPIDARWIDEPNLKKSFTAFTQVRTKLIARRFEELAGARLFVRV